MADDVIASPQAAPAPAASRMAVLAIVSLVLAILSFACLPILPVIPAIVCGHLAWSKINKSGGALNGKGIALAGLILGYLAVPWAVLQTWFLVGMFQGERVRLQDLAVQEKEIVSDDGKLKITASGFWVKRSDLNKKASLQAAYNTKDMYVIVLSEPKPTVPDMMLQQHHQITRDHILKAMTNSSATEPISTTIDNRPALQDELSGTDQGKNVVFLHTTVDEGDSFQQIMAWTLKGRWKEQSGELREATNSFHAEK
jgi:uncharacterized protein DUF4190